MRADAGEELRGCRWRAAGLGLGDDSEPEAAAGRDEGMGLGAAGRDEGTGLGAAVGAMSRGAASQEV